MSIAIFFGSTTGNTEAMAELIGKEIGESVKQTANITDIEPEELLNHEVLILGIPTWNVGEMQYDWEDFVPRLEGMDLTGKKIGLFGLGDSFGYSENFLDALGLLWDELKQLGNPELVGVWSTEGYIFDESKGMFDDKHFLGLGLDEENEPDLHEERIKAWAAQVRNELGLAAAG
jgi:flavodoxin I